MRQCDTAPAPHHLPPVRTAPPFHSPCTALCTAARYAIISHVVHLVNRDYLAMCLDYYALDFMDPSVDTTPIAPALAAFFDDVLNDSVSQLNFRAIVDGLGGVLFQYPFRCGARPCIALRASDCCGMCVADWAVWVEATRSGCLARRHSSADCTLTVALPSRPPAPLPPPYSVPAYYALILRSLTVLEGLALTADPQYKLIARAYPYMARRLLTDPAPELR